MLSLGRNGTKSSGQTATEPSQPSIPRWQQITRLGPRGSAPRRAALTMTDQCFASASNFVVGVIVARLSGPAGLGAYSVAYALWLMVAAAHRSIITDPMSIENDARREGARARIQAGLAAELTLGAAVAVSVLVVSLVVLQFGQHEVGMALLTFTPFIPFLLVQDYWRWVGFMQAKPGRSLLNDTVFNCVQGLLLIALIFDGLRSPSVAIVAWGVGAVVAAFYGLRQFSVSVQVRGGYTMVASRWYMSKWILASGVSSWSQTQAYPIVAGPIVGSDGLGGLKAATSLVSGPSMVLIQATGSMGLPEASDALEQGGWPKLRRVARWVTIAGAASVGSVALIVFVGAEKLLGAIYGPQFVQYANTARIIAFAWVIGTFAGGSFLVLKVTRNTRSLFTIGVIEVVILLVGIIVLSPTIGVNGTAWAMVISDIVGVVLLRRSQKKVAREYREAALVGSTT
jgi:O-antigen/teichoic acid export membrane protein